MPDNPEKTAWNFHRQLLAPKSRRPPPSVSDELAFGKHYSNHMVVCDYIASQGGWQQPSIVPFGPFTIYPDAVVFHYGQQIFEGLKAFRQNDTGRIAIFRPDMNAKRFQASAERLGMQPVPIDLFMQSVHELVTVDQEFVLPLPASLYIRPCLIPLDRGVAYRAAVDYRFFVIVCAVSQYFSAHAATTVYVEQTMARAAPGGIGNIKAGCNYSGAVKALNYAKQIGADSVLWLDANEKRFVEEIGAMNIFFVYDDRVVTPPLLGTILPGITRDSLITLLRHWDVRIDEERLDINQVINDARTGLLKEAFGAGTAAVVSPIKAFIFNNETITVGDGQPGPMAIKLKKGLQEIQDGEAEDLFGWKYLI